MTAIQHIKKNIIPTLKQHGITKAGLFGSHATGKTHKKSDIDLLVKIKKNISLLDFISLKLEIEKKIGRKVDLVEYKTIKPALRKKILAQEISLL